MSKFIALPEMRFLCYIYYRYEGPRTAEALTEYVNTEGGSTSVFLLKLFPVGQPSEKFFLQVSCCYFDW
jgi:hypothetical protein